MHFQQVQYVHHWKKMPLFALLTCTLSKCPNSLGDRLSGALKLPNSAKTNCLIGRKIIAIMKPHNGKEDDDDEKSLFTLQVTAERM